MTPASRRLVLPGVLALVVLAGGWWFSQTTDEPKAPARPARSAVVTKPGAARPVGAPRSLQGLTLDSKSDISADARTPNTRRESIIRLGLGELQEMKQMNPAVFDDAAKRWNAQPRVKEIIARWKEVEETWKTQDDEAKATVVPQMEAMWKEALGLLREEVEKSAREAQAGVK
jgi:hypothetical protein